MPTPRTWTTRKQPRAAAEEQKVTDDVGLAVTSKGRANANMTNVGVKRSEGATAKGWRPAGKSF